MRAPRTLSRLRNDPSGLRSRANAMVELFVLPDDLFGREVLAGPRFCRLAEPVSPDGIRDERFYGASQGVGVVGRNQEPVDSRLDDLRNPTDRRGHARASETHGFENAEAETFQVGCE